jgi:deoxycytidylate deaminase
MNSDLLIKTVNLLRTIAEDIEPVSNARLAAAIVHKNKIVSVGFNQYKTHPFAVEYAKNSEANTLHAETDAILKAKRKLTEKELRKSTLIVVRMKKDHVHRSIFGIAKPCCGCSKCIVDHGIGTVIYTLNSKDAELRYVTEVFG